MSPALFTMMPDPRPDCRKFLWFPWPPPWSWLKNQLKGESNEGACVLTISVTLISTTAGLTFWAITRRDDWMPSSEGAGEDRSSAEAITDAPVKKTVMTAAARILCVCVISSSSFVLR